MGAVLLLGSGCTEQSGGTLGVVMEPVWDSAQDAVDQMGEGFSDHMRTMQGGSGPGAVRTPLIQVRDLLFGFLAFVVISWGIVRYMLEGNTEALLFSVIRVLVVWVVMILLPDIVEGLYEAQQNMKSILQDAILEGGGGEGGLTSFFNQTQDILNQAWEFKSFQAESYRGAGPDSWWNVLEIAGSALYLLTTFVLLFVLDLAAAGLIVVMKLLVILLVVVGFVVEMYATVVFFIAAAMGPILFPFVLWRPLDFLGTGWVRSMASMWVFGVVATLIFCFVSRGFGFIAAIAPMADSGQALGAIPSGVTKMLYVIYLVFAFGLVQRIGDTTTGIISGMGIGGGADGGVGRLVMRGIRG